MDNLPFSQRNGYTPTITQHALGFIPQLFKEKIKYIICKNIIKYDITNDIIISILLNYCNVNYQNRCVISYTYCKNYERNLIIDPIVKTIDSAEFYVIFDIIEYLLSIEMPDDICKQIKQLFIEYKMAYRIVDNLIIAIGNEEQGEAYLKSLDDADKTGPTGARQHLINAGLAIRNNDWAGSIRESISAVESVCRKIAGTQDTLGKALSILDKKKPIHPAFKKALEQLYGYTSDENGIRHSLIEDANANVDEVDALFMLGSCASFVSYLLAKNLSDNA